MFDRLGRVGALIVILLVAVTVSYPAVFGARVVSPKGRDSFPLSWYPMFSSEVKDRRPLIHIVGFDRDGNEFRIPYTFFTAGGMNEGRARLNRMARARNGGLKRTCKKVARRLSKRRKRDKRFRSVKRVEVVRSIYDPRKYFTGEEPDPLARRQIKARCNVKKRRKKKKKKRNTKPVPPPTSTPSEAAAATTGVPDSTATPPNPTAPDSAGRNGPVTGAKEGSK